MRRNGPRGRAPALANLAALALIAACATKPDKPPAPPPTESEIRKRLNDAQTALALDELKELTVREQMERHFQERRRDAARRQRQFAAERAVVAENIGIGNGLALVRVFSLYPEYDDKTFTTYLAATELIGGRIRTALATRVGALGDRFASLDFVELDRAVLKVALYREKEPPCCPTEIGQVVYTLRGMSLEPLR